MFRYTAYWVNGTVQEKERKNAKLYYIHCTRQWSAHVLYNNDIHHWRRVRNNMLCCSVCSAVVLYYVIMLIFFFFFVFVFLHRRRDNIKNVRDVGWHTRISHEKRRRRRRRRRRYFETNAITNVQYLLCLCVYNIYCMVCFIFDS